MTVAPFARAMAAVPSSLLLSTTIVSIAASEWALRWVAAASMESRVAAR